MGVNVRLTFTPILLLIEAKMKRTTLERFETKFVKVEDCWIWTACITPNGYGMFSLGKEGGGVTGAHRASWILYRGPIPDGLWVLHNCPGGDRTACVNPAHLFLGTHQDNMDDKVAKGRQSVGEAHGLSKLTAHRVREIRTGRAHGISASLLAQLYDVDRTHIHAIITGKVWAHTPGQLEGDELEEILDIFKFQQAAWEAERSDKARESQKKSVAAHYVKAASIERPATKTCPGYDRDSHDLPLTDEFFYRNKKSFQRLCKDCSNKRSLARYHGPKHEELKQQNLEKAKERYEADKDAAREKRKAAYHKDVEKSREQGREYEARRKEDKKAYREAHKEEIKAKNAEHRAKNREQILASAALYRAENADAIKERQCQRQENTPSSETTHQNAAPNSDLLT